MPGETIIGKNFSLIPGGKGANQAYALGKLGVNVNMLGLVGNDEYGKILVNNLNSVNVNTDNIVTLQGTNTGCAFINVNNSGENSIIVISGANNKMTTELINKNINLIKCADIIIMQLEIPIDVVTHIAKIAKSYNKLVILDPAPAPDYLPDDLLANVDIIKPNETELKNLTNINCSSKDDILYASKILLQKGVKNVITTLGEKGSILVNNNETKFFSSPIVKAVDTTAAGDCFVAALAKALTEEKNLYDAIEYGHLVSSIAVTKKGAQTSIPSLEEIEKFITERKI